MCCAVSIEVLCPRANEQLFRALLQTGCRARSIDFALLFAAAFSCAALASRLKDERETACDSAYREN
jgi:hypothetical protein